MPNTQNVPKKDVAELLQLLCGLSDTEVNDPNWVYELKEETDDHREWSVTHPALGGLTYREPVAV